MTYQYTMHKHRHKSSLTPKPDLKIESLTSLPQLRFDNGRVYYSETRQITDRFSYRHITNCRPTVSQQSAYISGKTCWPFVGRQTADSRPTVGQQTTNSRPTVGRQFTDTRPTGFLGCSSSQLPKNLYESTVLQY